VIVIPTGDGCGVGIAVGTGDGIYGSKSMNMHRVNTKALSASAKNQV